MRRLAKAFAGSSPATERRPGLASLCLLALAALLGTGAPSASAADTCPNAAVRAEQGAGSLSECRAWELVSPVEKKGNPIKGAIQAAPAGDAVAYQSNGAFADADSTVLGSYYIGRRTTQGWSVDPLEPSQSNPESLIALTTFNVSEDLSKSAQYSAVALAPGAIQNGGNIYLRDNLTGARTVLAASPDRGGILHDTVLAGVHPFPTGSADLSHLIFNTSVPLVSDAPTGSIGGVEISNIYEAVGGELRLVNRLPDGTPTLGAGAGNGEVESRAVSADGSRIFFAGPNSSGVSGLYVRENGQTTTPISVSQRTGEEGVLKRAVFKSASKDGSIVYFSCDEFLTNEDQKGIYRYDLDTKELTVVTKVRPDDPFSGPMTFSSWFSADGSTAYFSAWNDLTGTGQFFGGNLYMWRNGEITLLGTTGEFTGPGDGAVSPNGRYFSFSATGSPTGFDNGSLPAVYTWDAVTKQLSCASCGQPGETSSGVVNAETYGASDHLPRAVLNDGRFFFSTNAPLMPDDINGRMDVYEWKNGTARLLSSGRGPVDSFFQDSTPSGNDVFFTTPARLVGIDADGDADLYDARVDGGLSSQAAPPPTSVCEGESCRGPASAPPPGSESATTAFAGPGNAGPERKPRKASKRCKKGKRHGGKCRSTKRKHRSSSSKSRGSK